MATIAVTPDQDAIEAEIFIAAPPERVFQVLTDPNQMPRSGGDSKACTASRSGRRICAWAASGQVSGWVPTAHLSRVDGESLEVDPQRRLVPTWVPSYSQTRNTVVRWELSPREIQGLQSRGPQKMGTVTALRLRHSGFAGDLPGLNSHGKGWKRVLGWTQAFLEQGETVDTRKPITAAS